MTVSRFFSFSQRYSWKTYVGRWLGWHLVNNFTFENKIKMFDKSNKNFIWDCSKIVCSCPCTVVLDYVEMWRHSHWLCRHDVRGHSETTMPTWISAVNFGRLSLTLKEQSSKNKYLSVFTFPIAIFWKVENGVLPKAKVVCLENFNLCNWISRLKISWHSPFKSFTFTMTISVAT